ncbi:hypothetical protein [Microbacterium sp. SGAir0570]|uniref:hypothetical protein n=1 Tax=Microbacterium sp. SGAir0570 TaxID=2070348 RepID=UPI0010F8446D|nr:hypothetical protein [Microbacterium sp. SGAir0570]
MAGYARQVITPWAPVEVASADEISGEPLGTKEKYWVVNPEDESVWLFKFAREGQGRTLGEDWAEWLVHHLATCLGVPTAQVMPARCDGRRGIVSRRTNNPEAGQRLDHGNSLLVEVVPDYESARKRENPGYTVAAVQQALRSATAPPTFTGPSEMDAFDVWAGYLLLDAWVAGRDRHHENWGVISSTEGRALSPSFDHGNALGFQETSSKLARLNDDLELRSRWLDRGRSHHFAGRPSLVDLAKEALNLASPVARQHWGRQMQSIDLRQVAGIVYEVPTDTMSEAARTFALNVLLENRERLTS